MAEIDIDRCGVITQHEVMYEPLMTFGGQITTLTVNTTNLSITLMNLEEYVEYNISVRAYTSVGPGPYSVGIVRRTFEDGKPTLSLQNCTVNSTCTYVLASPFTIVKDIHTTLKFSYNAHTILCASWILMGSQYTSST